MFQKFGQNFDPSKPSNKVAKSGEERGAFQTYLQ